MHTHPGIGRYIRELTAHFPEDQSFSFRFIKEPVPIYSWQEQLAIPHLAKGGDLLHVPHFNIPFFWPGKLVVTIHDLIYLTYPKTARSRWAPASMRLFMEVVSRKASAILTVSEFTKKELLRLFPRIKPDRVVVTHEAVSEDFQPMDASDVLLRRIQARLELYGPFVLFVGSLKPHKNLPGLINAMEALKRSSRIPHSLIVAGRIEGADEELRRLLKTHSFIRCLGEVSDEELRALYSLATVFVLPSHFEGFGLPVLEAMACGCPVIVSNAASLPEVAGEAGILFDLRHIDALNAVLYNVLTDQNLRNSMKKKGLEQIQKFSWTKTARQTLEVYQKVCQ